MNSLISFNEYEQLLNCGFSCLNETDGLEKLRALNGKVLRKCSKTNNIIEVSPYISSWALWHYTAEPQYKIGDADSSWKGYLQTVLNGEKEITPSNFANLQKHLKRNVVLIGLNASEPAEGAEFEKNEFFHYSPATQSPSTNRNTRFLRSLIYNHKYGGNVFKGAYITDLFKIKNSLNPMIPTITVSKKVKALTGDADKNTSDELKDRVFTYPNFKILYNELNILRNHESVLLVPMGRDCANYLQLFLNWLEKTHFDDFKYFVAPKFKNKIEYIPHYAACQYQPKALNGNDADNRQTIEKNNAKVNFIKYKFNIFEKTYDEMIIK